jgi:hypothetical protein
MPFRFGQILTRIDSVRDGMAPLRTINQLSFYWADWTAIGGAMERNPHIGSDRRPLQEIPLRLERLHGFGGLFPDAP